MPHLRLRRAHRDRQRQEELQGGHQHRHDVCRVQAHQPLRIQSGVEQRAESVRPASRLRGLRAAGRRGGRIAGIAGTSPVAPPHAGNDVRAPMAMTSGKVTAHGEQVHLEPNGRSAATPLNPGTRGAPAAQGPGARGGVHRLSAHRSERSTRTTMMAQDIVDSRPKGRASPPSTTD